MPAKAKRATPPVVELTAAELAAVARARRCLVGPTHYRTPPAGDLDAIYAIYAEAALKELTRPVPTPAEPDPPLAAALGGVPRWVSTGDTGMWPVLGLGLNEENG